MKPYASTITARLAIVLFAMASTAAAGQTVAQAPAEETKTAAESSEDTAFDAAPVTDATLQGIAGREDLLQVSQSELIANSSDNSVGDNSTTGDVRITDSAFQNMSGLSLINFNTGNNVAMNSSMNVNIVINPPQP